MKTERRHDLETNWLASHVAQSIERVKPYSAMIWVAIIGVLVVAIGSLVVANQSSARNTEAWTAYYNAMSRGQGVLEALEIVADEHAGTPVEEWADIVRADLQLGQASIVIFANQASAEKLLTDARRTYVLLQNNDLNPPIRNRASYGLGRVYELEGQLEKAKAEYAKVEDGVFAPLAKMRAEAISQDDAEEFYDWFATAQPASLTPPQGPGTPGARPAFEPGALDNVDGELQPDLGLDIGAGLEDDSTGGRYADPPAEDPMPGDPTPVEAADSESTEGGEGDLDSTASDVDNADAADVPAADAETSDNGDGSQ